MKKVIICLCLVLGMMTNVYAKSADNASSNVKECLEKIDGIGSTIHDDTKDVVSTLHDDTKVIITTVYGDGKEMVKELYPEVKAAVVEIGKAIGVAAEHVYTVLVKKYFVDGLKELFLFVIGLVLLIIGWVKIHNIIKLNAAIDWHVLFPSVLCLASFFCLVNVNYDIMFMGLFNPEWGAINYILDYTKILISK